MFEGLVKIIKIMELRYYTVDETLMVAEDNTMIVKK